MHDLEENKESVNYLITELCRCQAKQNGLKASFTAVGKLKSLAYDVLLKKKPISSSVADENKRDYEDFDPQYMLDKQIFAAKIRARSHPAKLADFQVYKEQLEFVKNEPYFQENTGRAILQFLTVLKCVQNHGKDDVIPCTSGLLVPGPFTLHYVQKNQHYPVDINEDWLRPQPKSFKGVHEFKNESNPYMPRCFVNGETNHLAAVKQKYGPPQSSERNNYDFKRRIGPIEPCAFSLTQNKPLLKDRSLKLPKLLTHNQETKAKKENKIERAAEPRCFSWNWENLGQSSIPKPRPYISESQMTLQLKGVVCKSQGKPFEIYIVSLPQFMQDLKSLTVGIQSDIFQHDEQLVFSMKPNITVPGLLPASLAHYAEHFLECGTCYKRMKSMIMKHDYKFIIDGFMFRGLCSALDEYLFTFRQVVYAQQDINLIEFYKRMRKCLQQMRNLAFTVAVHPQTSNISPRPPLGSQFLGYLYREILRCTERDFTTLLMFILKRCCHFYFKHLQQWIFKGVLDDPSNELFINYVGHYRPQTKYFYDKAFQIKKEAVPGFFQNFEQQILQCGKYTMLLKGYKPDHAIFNVPHPALTVCLSYDEIQKLEVACVEYKTLAECTLQKPTSVREIFEDRALKRRNFLQQVRQRACERMNEWHKEQQELAATAAKRKRNLYAQLSTQLEETRLHKLAERRLRIEQELKALQDAQKLEDSRLLSTNINLTKRIEYYEEMHKILNDEISEKDASNLNRMRSLDNLPSTISRTSQATTDYWSCKSDRSENDNDDEVEDEDDEVFVECLSEEGGKSLESKAPSALLYKRSKSDLINSNTQSASPLYEVQAISLSDLQQNKLNMLSGISMHDCLNEIGENKVHEINYTAIQRSRNNMLSGTDIRNCLNEEMQTVTRIVPAITLSEAQCNKLRVLTAECEKTTDINLNILPVVRQVSDLQRNRQRNMSNEPFNDMYAEREKMNLNLEQDQKEHQIASDLTPMSTTSDNLIDLDIDEDNNNNNNKNNIEEDPTIEVETLLSENCTENQVDEELDEADEEEWHSANRSQCDDLTSDDSGLMFTDYYKDPYKRCKELMDSNFKCASRSHFIRLNKLQENTTKIDANENQDDKTAALNVMSIITLTEFLQKSLVLPMQTHLELVKNEVMRLALVDLRVLEHLRSLRHYCLLMDGEFGSIICDNIIQKMEDGVAPITLLNFQTLHGILETALGASMRGATRNAENLSFIVTEIPEKFDLNSPNALSTLTLSYNVDWPLNLILNVETIDQYSNVFRYLLKVRRISWILERAFQILKHAVSEHGKQILQSPQYRRVQQMRHKLYHFVHALQNHITANALESSWKTFKDDLMSAKTIEDIYRKHSKYMKRILFLCMLNRKSFTYLSTIESIFKISLKFFYILKSSPFELREGEQHFTHGRFDKLSNCDTEFDKCLNYVLYLGKKIMSHGYQEEVGEFLTLINFNYYYSSKSKEHMDSSTQSKTSC